MAGQIGRRVRTVLRVHSIRTQTHRHVRVVPRVICSGQSEMSAGAPITNYNIYKYYYISYENVQKC